jgi:putative flippase GtrA
LAQRVSLTVSTVISFVLAAAANYFLCITLLLRHKARWNSVREVAMYAVVVMAMGAFDLGATSVLYSMGMAPWLAKSFASILGLAFNFLGRKYVVF